MKIVDRKKDVNISYNLGYVRRLLKHHCDKLFLTKDEREDLDIILSNYDFVKKHL